MSLRTAVLSLLSSATTDRIDGIASGKQTGKWKIETGLPSPQLDPTRLVAQMQRPPFGAIRASLFAKLSPNAAEADAAATATNEVASEKAGKPLFGKKPKKGG